MLSLCGTDCCKECPNLAKCGGCEKSEGHPLGGVCIAAEWVKTGGIENMAYQKKHMIDEFNSLGIEGLKVNDLNFLSGAYVNLEYRLPNGVHVKMLEDDKVYLGNQIEIPGKSRCYGIVGDDTNLLVCEYGCGGADAEIILYKKRDNVGCPICGSESAVDVCE